MRFHRTLGFTLVLLVLTAWGCAEQTATTQPSPPAPTGVVSAPTERAEPPMGAPPAPPASPVPPPVPAPSPPAARVEGFTEQPALRDVLFEAGRTEIGKSGAEIMKSNARWLTENPGYLVVIEGHSDYRGSREGNLAAAARRAKAVMHFLIQEGISETRIQIVTYGSDRPVCPERTEACAAKNRRVHFLVKPQ